MKKSGKRSVPSAPAAAAPAAATGDLTRQQATQVLVGLIALSTIGFSWLANQKHMACTVVTGDTALYGFAYFHTLSGKLFPLLTHEGSLLGNHINFMLFIWLPVFAVLRSMFSLFLFQSLMISLAAWPVYLLAHDKTGNRRTALIAAAGLLLFPPIVGQHVNQIHDDQFGLVFLLFAFLFFERSNFKAFALCFVGALLAKETIALNVAFFGVYALVRRRTWQWVAFPIVGSALYVALAVKVLLPMWGVLGVRVYSEAMYFTEFGKTPGEVLTTMLTKPGLLLGIIFSGPRLGYLLRLLAPLLLVLPFGNWSWLVAAPMLGVNLLGSNTALRVLPWHYGILVGGSLWCSFVCALRWWNTKLNAWFGARDYTRGLCIVALVLCVVSYPFWLQSAEFTSLPGASARAAAIAFVPANASVFSPENMQAHFVNRPATLTLGQLLYHRPDKNELFDYEYVVFDGNYIGPDWQGQKNLYQFISQHPAYKPAFGQDNIVIFKRVGTPERNLK